MNDGNLPKKKNRNKTGDDELPVYASATDVEKVKLGFIYLPIITLKQK
ncbi:hypothetical protein BH11BAC5_BH11BAC5_32310 [soil metagenome]